MSWKDILKGKSTAPLAKRTIDKIMSDGKARSMQEIKDALFDYLKSINERRKDNESLRTGRYLIPNSSGISTHLRQSGYKKKIEKRRHPLALPNDRIMEKITVWYKE
jgi:hypothetical protein